MLGNSQKRHLCLYSPGACMCLLYKCYMVTIQTLFAFDTGVTFVEQYTDKKENKIVLLNQAIQKDRLQSYI
jgi:hypothetical protein